MPAEVTTTPASPAAESAQTTPPPATPPPPPKVELPVEEYQRLVSLGSQLAELQRANQAALEAKEQERIKALAEKGQIEQALEALNKTHADKLSAESQRYADLERQVFAEKQSATISQALAGRAFVSPDAASQVQEILASKVEVVRDASGNLTAVDKLTRRPAGDVLRELLDSPSFAHFLAPVNPQGGAGQQGNRVQQAKTDTPPDFTQQVANEYIAAQSQWPSFGLKPRTK